MLYFYSKSMRFYLHPYSVLFCLFPKYLNVILTFKVLLSTELLGFPPKVGPQYFHFGFQSVSRGEEAWQSSSGDNFQVDTGPWINIVLV